MCFELLRVNACSICIHAMRRRRLSRVFSAINCIFGASAPAQRPTRRLAAEPGLPSTSSDYQSDLSKFSRHRGLRSLRCHVETQHGQAARTVHSTGSTGVDSSDDGHRQASRSAVMATLRKIYSDPCVERDPILPLFVRKAVHGDRFGQVGLAAVAPEHQAIGRGEYAKRAHQLGRARSGAKATSPGRAPPNRARPGPCRPFKSSGCECRSGTGTTAPSSGRS